MSQRLVFPVIEEESSTKDIVIEILSEEFPLSIKKIYNTIRKNYGKSVSYHAVYKAVYELLEEKVLVKKGLQYSLNRDYIERLSHFMDKLKLNYEKEGKLAKELTQRDFVVEILNSQYEMALFIIDMLKSVKKGEIITIVWPVVWPSLTVPEIYPKLREIGKKAEAYCICSADGFLDKHFAKYWRELGVNLKLGVRLDSIFEVFVFRDLLLLIYQPPDKRIRKYKYIDVLKGLKASDRDKIFLKAIKEKTEIYAFVIKNRAIADEMKQDIMSYF